MWLFVSCQQAETVVDIDKDGYADTIDYVMTQILWYSQTQKRFVMGLTTIVMVLWTGISTVNIVYRFGR